MTISVQGIETYYEEAGEGMDVLMLPGWAAKCMLYRPVADAICSACHVILLDLPGFTGGTPEPPSVWNVDDYADFVSAFIEKMGIKRLVLMGHSFGGRILLKLLNRPSLPFEADRLVLIDAAGIRHELSKSTKRKQGMLKFAGKFLPDSVLDKLKEKHGSADYRNASPLMRQCLVRAIEEDLTGCLSGIPCETLLIWGTADTATPISDGETMEKLIPNAGLVRLENAGHFSFLDQPVIFDKVMKSYFNIT